MKNTEFILTLADLCKVNTCYATGAFGAVVDLYNNRTRYAKNTKNKDVKAAIEDAPAGTFLFDCINLGKSLLWGFNFDTTMRYGGANYKANDVPEFGVKSVKKYGESSTDFSTIQEGEWMVNDLEDHVGYADGQGGYYDISQHNEGYKVLHHESMTDRNWKYHCKMQWIDYDPEYVEAVCPHCGKPIHIFLTAPTK